MSAEEFCGLLTLPPKTPNSTDDRLEQFAKLLNDIPQNITFLVVYRHYFDWAYSTYTFYEIFENSKLKSLGDKSMQSILDQQDFFSGSDTRCSPRAMWVFLRDQLIPLLDRGDLRVFNFHTTESDDFATRFICSLPHSHEACNRSRHDLHLERARVTDVDLLHADRIATGAWNKKLYNANQTSVLLNQRQKVRELVVHHVRNTLNKTFSSLSKECLPDNVLSRNLEFSIRTGTEMLGEELLAVNALEEHFERNKAAYKFCSVNVTALLEEQSWQHFFQELEVLPPVSR